MARRYTHTLPRRLVNWMVGILVPLGLGPTGVPLLTVPGRKSRQPRTTPVSIIEQGGQRWLVAPYGPVNWVRNVRAAGQVTLTRGRRPEAVQLEELGATEAAPVLKEFALRVPITRPYFAASPHGPVEAFVAEASQHPVFRIINPRTR